MFKEHERIVLISDILVEGLVAGDVGTIVHVHPRGEAFVVEFHDARREYGCHCNGPVIAGSPSNFRRYKKWLLMLLIGVRRETIPKIR